MRASGPVLTSLFLFVPDHSAAEGRSTSTTSTTNHLSLVIETLEKAATLDPTSPTAEWADARRDAITALANIVVDVGVSQDITTDGNNTQNNNSVCGLSPAQFESVFRVMLAALEDYTTDSRGDVGSLVREAAIEALQKLLTFAADSEAAWKASSSSTSHIG